MLAILTLLVAGAGQARQPSDVDRRYSPAYSACLNHGEAAQGVTAAMRGCSGDELARQNIKLNAAYKRAMQIRSPEQRLKLRDLERGWINARHAKCDHAEADVDGGGGGTMGLLLYDGCMIEETIRRTIWLEHLRY